MRRKRLKTFLFTFIIISVAVLTGFVFNNFGNKMKDDSHKTQNETSESVSGNYGDSNNEDESLSFYINESTVKKTKTTVNEVTLFTIEAKLFITNNGSKTVSIDVDEFKANYDTEGTGKLLSMVYENVENPILLEANGKISVTFTMQYVINDVENFNDYKKHDLKFSYAERQILVCQA